MPEIELRRQIMAKLSAYRFEMWDRWEMLRLFDERFAERLRSERCRQPKFSVDSLIVVPLAIMGLAYWFGGPLDALVAGVGIVLPALVFLAIYYIANLHRHDVIMQEAIRFVERNAAVSKEEAHRRLHLPEIFSRREERTGEPGGEVEAVSADAGSR